MRIPLLLVIILIIGPTFGNLEDSSLNFLNGLLQGTESKILLENIKNSIQNKKFVKHIQKGFVALEESTAGSALESIKQFSKALKQIIEAARESTIEQANGIKLEELIQTFSNPKSFSFDGQLGVQLNGRDITPELKLSLERWKSNEFEESGYYLGKAISQTVFGEGYNKMEYVEVEPFIRGIFDSLILQVRYDDVKNCISLDDPSLRNLVFDSSEIATWNKEAVTQVLSGFASRLQILPNAVEKCIESKEIYDDLNNALEVFRAPISIHYNKGKNLIINGIEMYPVFLGLSYSYEDRNSYQFGANVGYMLNLALDGQNTKIGNMKSDLEDFAYGVLAGIGAAEKWPEIKACFNGDKTMLLELDEAYRNISRRTPESVRAGLHVLGEALETIPSAIQDCKVVIEDLDGLIRAIHAFESPTSFIYRIGISLILNGREIYHDIEKANEAYKAHNFTGFGYYVGHALALLFLKGDSPLISQDFVDYINSKAAWTATIPTIFETLSSSQIKSFLVDVPRLTNTENYFEYDYRGLSIELPSQFDSSKLPPTNFPTEEIIVRNAESMQHLIASYGPVEVHMKVYEDFLYYSDGIYSHLCGDFIGTHAVRVVGWGEADGVRYWIVENNWGFDWGQNGMAKVAFGDSDIDSYAEAGFLLDWVD